MRLDLVVNEVNWLLFLCRVELPVAIVDTLNNINLMYGEVLVYDVDVSAVSGRNVNCTVVTLRFTEFSSK